MPETSGLRIVDFEARHRDAFHELNLAGIKAHFEVEEPDRRQLLGPETSILEPGGSILVAESQDRMIGVCALIRQTDAHYELAKMATSADLRRRGVGRKPLAAAIITARPLGARKPALQLSQVQL